MRTARPFRGLRFWVAHVATENRIRVREMDPSAFVFMALSGEGEHGPSSGAVVVDASKGHAKFTPFGDLHPAPMRKQMRDQAASNPGNLYVLSKTDKHVHVFAYPRDKAAQQLRDGTLPALMP